MKRILTTINRRNERIIYLVVGAESEAERIPVYNQLLLNASPEFKRLVEAMEPDNPDLEILGVSKKIMHILVEYLYQTFQAGEYSLPMTDNNVHELFFAANFFELPDVQSLCRNYIKGMEIQVENCIQLYTKTPESISVNFKAKCLDFILSSMAQLISSQPFANLTFIQLRTIIHTGRAQNKCSDDLLCEATINWLKHRRKERRSKVKEIMEEFPSKEHKQRIIQNLYEIPATSAFYLVSDLYDDGSDHSSTTAPATTTNATTTPDNNNNDDNEDPVAVNNVDEDTAAVNIVNEDPAAINHDNEDPAALNNVNEDRAAVNEENISNENDIIEEENIVDDNNTINNRDAPAFISPLKRVSISARVIEEPTSVPGPSRGILATSPPAAKRNRPNETAQENNDESRPIFNPPPGEDSVHTTLNNYKYLPFDDLHVSHWVDLPHFSPESSIGQISPVLSITLQKKQPKLRMVKMFQNNKTLHDFQHLSKLSDELALLENGREIWLKVSEMDLSSEEIVGFMEKFSNDISTLTLCYGSLAKMSPVQLQILLRKLPNLNYLCVATIPTEWKLQNRVFFRPNADNSDDPGKPYFLPQIKKLSFCASPEFYPYFLMSLLQLLPNLESIYYFPLYCASIFSAHDQLTNLKKIRSVNFTQSPTAGSKLKGELSQFASMSQNTRLEMADLEFKLSLQQNSQGLWKSCCASLFKILKNNENTMEYIMLQPLPLPQLLKYPEMKRVKKLRMINCFAWKKCEDGARTFKFFGEGFSVATAFPNLSEVTFDGKDCALDDFLLFFPDDAFDQPYFQGVTSLRFKFGYFETLEALEKVAKLFPDLTSFYTNQNISSLEHHLSHIFRLWPKLTNLTLKVDVFHNARQTVVVNYPLDPLFTGFSVARCSELREHKGRIDNIDLEIYRGKLAISNMTELKELTLIFHGECLKTRKVDPLLSHVSSYYAFQYIPDLKVTCAIPWDNKSIDKIREMLNPIEGYVILNPNYY